MTDTLAIVSLDVYKNVVYLLSIDYRKSKLFCLPGIHANIAIKALVLHCYTTGAT